MPIIRTPIPILASPALTNSGAPRSAPGRVQVLDFLHLVRWLDGSPILDHVEPYRRRILADVLDTWDVLDTGPRVRYNLALLGRSKKNAKSLDLCLAALFALLANDSLGGNEVYVIAADEGQAGDDLSLVKKLVIMSPHLLSRVIVREKSIQRKDNRGSITILPGRDILGSHGKTARAILIDEVHTQRDWSLLEAMQIDPTRPDAQMILTSYASIYHRPGVPLFDLFATGKKGTDPRFYFSWYAADFTTDPAFADLDPEHKANPSLASFEPDYLEQQRRRLPSHVYRRLHLNLPGLPEGSAFTAEIIFDAISRGVRIRKPERGIQYFAFVDMSGGSHDDATCGISYRDPEGKAILAHLLNQGPAPPFDPRKAVDRFAGVCKEYGITRVLGDKYAGEVFIHDFLRHGIAYDVCALPASKLYEMIEPHLNAREVVLLDHNEMESQFLGLAWRGGKVTHANNEHDDFANAATGALLLALDPIPEVDTAMTDDEAWALRRWQMNPGGDVTIPPDEYGGNFFERF